MAAENKLLEDIRKIEIPNGKMKNFGRWMVIYALPNKTIKQIREDFIKPNVEKEHKLKRYFVDFRGSWENFLFLALELFWDNYSKKNKPDEKQKIDFIQSVYLAQEEYLSNLIGLIILKYDNEKNKKEKQLSEKSIKNLDSAYLDIHKLIAIQLRSHIVLSRNRKEFEKRFDNFLIGNPLSRRKKQTPDKYKEIFIKLRCVRDKNGMRETDTFLYNAVMLGVVFKNESKVTPYKTLDGYSRNENHKDEIKKIEDSITPEEEIIYLNQITDGHKLDVKRRY